MPDEQPEFVPPPEGLWILDDTGKNLKFLSEEELNQNAIETTDDTIPREPPEEVITEYLSTLTPPQKNMQDGFRDLGWNDVAITTCSLSLKMYSGTTAQGYARKGTPKLKSKSLIRSAIKITADEDYQLQLYLLDEVKRRRLVMLGEE
ncbi:unnamed protein product [Penicillium discolor]